MENVHKRLKPKSGHFIKDRKVEIVIGLLFFLAGSLLLYDAFDGRGKKMPWPGGAITPW
jgi:hypothetical protein